MADDLPPDAVPITQLSERDEVVGSDSGPDASGSTDPGAMSGPSGTSGPSGWVIGTLAVVLALMVGVGGVLVYQKATTPGAGSVDVGFMQDMTTHHQQAV